MAIAHDRMAHAATRILLQQLRAGTASWATPRLTPSSSYWHGIADWPRPDIAFQDTTTTSSVAFEFKPPSHNKREYVTGIGQTITYLRDFEFAGLIVPRLAGDGFPIAEYIRDLVREFPNDPLPIALLTYTQGPEKEADLEVLLPLQPRRDPPQVIPHGIGRTVFWGYWRDLSRYDVLFLIQTMAQDPSIDFASAFQVFWKERLVQGTALTWEGARRKAKMPTSRSYRSDETNAWLSLRHIGFLDASGRLTSDGLEAAQQGRVYGAESIAFLNLLTRSILEAGKHLELIFWVDEIQRSLPQISKASSKIFMGALDQALQETGIIPRVPNEGGKSSFLRDEVKLWNKLGLIQWANHHTYFHRSVGLVFNWRNILSAVS